MDPGLPAAGVTVHSASLEELGSLAGSKVPITARFETPSPICGERVAKAG